MFEKNFKDLVKSRFRSTIVDGTFQVFDADKGLMAAMITDGKTTGALIAAGGPPVLLMADELPIVAEWIAKQTRPAG